MNTPKPCCPKITISYHLSLNIGSAWEPNRGLGKWLGQITLSKQSNTRDILLAKEYPGPRSKEPDYSKSGGPLSQDLGSIGTAHYDNQNQSSVIYLQ